jgi:hypothetical protein
MAPRTNEPYRDPRENNRVAWITVAIAAAVIAIGFMAWNASDNVTTPNTGTTQTSAQ